MLRQQPLAFVQDDDIPATPEKGAAQAQPEATPPLFLPPAELTWGPAQGQAAGQSPPPYASSPTAVSMELTGGSLEGSEYSAHRRCQENLSRLLSAHLLDTAGSTGAPGMVHPCMPPLFRPPAPFMPQPCSDGPADFPSASLLGA